MRSKLANNRNLISSACQKFVLCHCQLPYLHCYLPRALLCWKADETWNLRENRTIGGLMVGMEVRGEADGDILDSVVDPAPLAVEIDDSESDSDEDSDEGSDSDK
jgi:hypothetical protein